MPLHLLDIRQCQVHRKVDQPAHFARPTGATSKLKIRAHSYELLIILYYQEIIIIKYKRFVKMLKPIIYVIASKTINNHYP